MAISITVTLDDTAPVPPVDANITVTQSPPPTQDQVTGAAGAVEGLSAVNVYKESGLTTLFRFNHRRCRRFICCH